MSDAFAELLKQVADDCGVTPEEVYREIEAAMAAAMASLGIRDAAERIYQTILEICK